MGEYRERAARVREALQVTDHETMTLYTSHACDDCIARYIGPALDGVIDDTPKRLRDKCYGCGRDDVQVRTFRYWFPWRADGSDCGCPAFHHSCGIVSPDLRTDPRIHCAECGMPADEDGYCTAVDCVRCGKTARG